MYGLANAIKKKGGLIFVNSQVKDIKKHNNEFITYGEEDKIVSLMKENGVLFPTFHTDKNIGVYMEQGKKEEALKTLHSNLSLAKRLGSEKVVVHLWSGSLDETNKTEN